MQTPTPGASDDQEQLLSRLLAEAFGALDAHALALLREHLHWVALAGGQTLMAEGEPGDSMYLSVSGRLRAYVKHDDGTPRMVREMARGQVIGEMSLITGEPRSATVVAIRDSVLVRLEKSAFDQLVGASPQVAMALTRQIIQRLKTEHQRAPYAAPVTVGLLPVSAGVDGAAFARDLAAQLARFGRVRVVGGALMASAAGDDEREDNAALHRRVALQLDAIEAAHEFVLLLADATPTPWTHLCSRHCDELLLLADATQPPVVHASEQQCLVQRPPRTEAAQILVLLHDAALLCPSGTRAWLDRRPVTEHLHLRPALARDMARLARLLSRNAIGLVLGGGGARGFAHLGVLRALQEQGIEIDCVGGTSIGAVMAWTVALDQPVAQLMPLIERSFARNPTGDFNLIPFVSLFAGRRLRGVLRGALQQLLGPQGEATVIEDLWKTFFCVASNYSQAREEVLRSGNLEAATLASIAIPGALPPVVRDGDLLCDGGTFNNYPADVMRAQRGIGCVIGVDLSARKPRRVEIDAVPSTWTLLRDRLHPRASRRYKLPALASILMNATILYSESRRDIAARLTDVHFKPPLERVGLMQWHRLKDIERQGFEHAQQVLAQPAVMARLARAPHLQ
jgi:NTE family protein